MKRASAAPADILDVIFADLPEALPAGGGVPDIIRKNRRERAKRRLRDALEARGPYPLTDALRVELRALAERWAQKGFDDAFPEADDFEVRCADERAVLEAAARGDEEERFAAAERAYLREVEKRHGWIEIRGLQLSARVHQDLEIAYVPLHVEGPPEARPARGPRKTKAGKKANGAGRKRDDEAMAAMLRALGQARVPAMRALGEHPRLLLIGEPGSGKSTLLAYLATRAARGELGAEVGWTENPVPFLVPVRSLRAEPLLEGIARVTGAERWFVEAALQRGRTLLLVDGLDEARPEVGGRLLHEFEATLHAYSGTRALVTTRPSAAPGEEQSSLAGFARVRLQPMTRDEVGRFIDQWCLAAELSLGKARAQAEADARAAGEDLKERVRASRAIEKLAQTPLLCSVICVVHRFLGQHIPERRVALYEAITNVLLYEWDRAKFPEGAATGKLDAHAKRALLARLARSMHEAGVAELPADEVVRKIGGHLPDLGQRAEEAAAIVAEIRDRNGVLVERGPGLFAFSHLTFQEYLSAMDVFNEHAYDLLLRNSNDKWWHEVVILAAGFPGADATRLVRGLLRKDGKDVAQGTMLAAQCAETAVELPASLRRRIEKRLARLIPPENNTEHRALVELGDVAGAVLLRALENASVDRKASILLILGEMGYEPAANAVGRSLQDGRIVAKPIPTSDSDFMFTPPTNVSLVAACAAFSMLLRSDAVLQSFLNSMPDAHKSAIIAFRVFAKGRSEVGRRIRTLIARYESAHPETASRANLATRRAERSG